MRRFLIHILILLTAGGCGLSPQIPQDPAVSGTSTDLGPAGNQAVTDAFIRHQNDTGKRCDPNLPGTRVILTGFGLFQGVPYNISAAITESMAGGHTEPVDGLITGNDDGVSLTTRSLEIDGKTYNLCFIVLDVKWDLAAAVIVWQAAHFLPEAILMTGRGGDRQQGFFEGGALNHAAIYPGFEADGRIDADNIPFSRKIIPGHPLNTPISMVWPNQRISTRANELLAGSPWSTSAPSAARSSNNYVCNNVSYVVLNAIRGEPFTLAGTSLGFNGGSDGVSAEADVTYDGSPDVGVGFLHLPAGIANTEQNLRTWAQVLETTITIMSE